MSRLVDSLAGLSDVEPKNTSPNRRLFLEIRPRMVPISQLSSFRCSYVLFEGEFKGTFVPSNQYNNCSLQ